MATKRLEKWFMGLILSTSFTFSNPTCRDISPALDSSKTSTKWPNIKSSFSGVGVLTESSKICFLSGSRPGRTSSNCLGGSKCLSPAVIFMLILCTFPQGVLGRVRTLIVPRRVRVFWPVPAQIRGSLIVSSFGPVCSWDLVGAGRRNLHRHRSGRGPAGAFWDRFVVGFSRVRRPLRPPRCGPAGCPSSTV